MSKTLRNCFNLAKDNASTRSLSSVILSSINKIADNCYKQKGAYTVLITLICYKIEHPQQDIRKHQSNMDGGFSGRSYDTSYITPTLRELGLPAMAESGWLTRSLEQPFPYTLDYNGKIQVVKQDFLNLVDTIQNHPELAQDILVVLLKKVIKKVEDNKLL